MRAQALFAREEAERWTALAAKHHPPGRVGSHSREQIIRKSEVIIALIQGIPNKFLGVLLSGGYRDRHSIPPAAVEVYFPLPDLLGQFFLIDSARDV